MQDENCMVHIGIDCITMDRKRWLERQTETLRLQSKIYLYQSGSPEIEVGTHVVLRRESGRCVTACRHLEKVIYTCFIFVYPNLHICDSISTSSLLGPVSGLVWNRRVRTATRTWTASSGQIADDHAQRVFIPKSVFD